MWTEKMYESRSEKKTSSRMRQKKTELRTGERRKKQEEKPKKFQFIHSLNKYNIRYGVFIYIIHFQRNVRSIHRLWCEKSLWGFQAPHGARFIDCTVFRNRSTVRANKWEPKKKKKKRNWEKNSKRKINSLSVRILLKATREKSCTYRHIDVFISHSMLEFYDVIAGIRRVNPKNLRFSGKNNKMKRWWKRNSSLNRKQNTCTVHCERFFRSLPYLLLLRSTEKKTKYGKKRWIDRFFFCGKSSREKERITWQTFAL